MMTAADTSHADIQRKVVRSATWMVALRIAMRVISVISQLIMVRLLTPSDFGLVAGAGVAYAILDGLTETSMTLLLVQMHAPDRQHYDTAWTLVALRGLLVGVLLWLSGPLMAQYLHDARVLGIVRVMAIVPIVQGLESVGMIRLQRDLQFGRIFFYQLTNKAVGFLTALPLALMYRSYWALVLGGAAARLVSIPLSYVLSPHRPRFSLAGARAMMHFSKWLLVTNLLTMVDNSMMAMILVRVADLRALGLYQVSYDLAALPASEIAAPVRRPMHAGYARVADDLAAFRQQVLSGLGVLVAVMVPMAAGIAATAPYVVHVALGPQWGDATPVLALAAVYTMFDAIGHFTGGIYMVCNAQRRYVAIMAACLALRLALVVPTAIYGGVVAAVAVLALTAVVNAVVWFAGLRTLIGVTTADLVRPVWRSFAASLVMLAALASIETVWPRSTQFATMLVQWGALCALGAGVHIATQLTLWRLGGAGAGPEAALLAALSAAIRARFAK